MTRDEMLIGWLVAVYHHFDHGKNALTPPAIQDALVAKGWLAVDERQWDGTYEAYLTDAGEAVVYLNHAEYGLEFLEEKV